MRVQLCHLRPKRRRCHHLIDISDENKVKNQNQVEILNSALNHLESYCQKKLDVESAGFESVIQISSILFSFFSYDRDDATEKNEVAAKYLTMDRFTREIMRGAIRSASRLERNRRSIVAVHKNGRQSSTRSRYWLECRPLRAGSERG